MEAEQSVIGALLRHPDAVDRMGDLQPAQFYRQDHRTIFTEILRQIAEGKQPDVISVGTQLGELIPDCLPYLNAMAQSTPSAANIGHYADLVRDRALRRGMLTVSSDLTDMALHAKGRTAAEVLDVAQSALAALGEARDTREPVRACEAMISHCKVIDDRVERKTSGIPTGFADIDALLSGGPNRGALVIVGARPSMGKTALALNIALNVAFKHSVLFLSQEMRTGELLDRALAALGSIPLGAVIRGELRDSDWSNFTLANSRLNELNLHLDDQPALTLLEVRAKARLTKRKHGLDLLVVDYLQLMTGSTSVDNRNQQIEEITRGLKALAKELDVVIIALSQLSRAAANKSRPQLADLRDSGGIEQDADVVLFVHRPEVDDPNTHLRGFADVFVAKNRQGRIADTLLTYEGEYTRFTSCTRPRPTPPDQRQRERRGLAQHL